MSKLGSMVFEDLVARGRNIKTARCWCHLVEKFVGCCGEKEEYGRGDVIKFVAMLRGEGYKQNSINTMIRPVKLLCEVQGWSDGFPKLRMKGVRRNDINRPIFSKEEVCGMIERGKNVLLPRELAYLVLSTIYGLRRVEICSAGVGDGKVKVNTAKGGDVVTHVVPDVVKPYLEGFKGAGVEYMTIVFKRMMGKLGVELNGEHHGWHSIRRRLTTELVLEDASLLNVMRFMRWSEGQLVTEFGMVAVYAKVEQEKVDRVIYKVHPFLEVWAEK